MSVRRLFECPRRMGAVLIFILAAAPCAPADEEARPSKPNVVLFFTDDQGTLDAHCYGAEDLHTPNIDRLAETGVRFTQAYAHTVCCPARAMLMTGRYPQRGGVNMWTQGNAKDAKKGRNMALGEVTLAEVLRQAGYKTALFGKWHLGAHLDHGPTKQGFDEFYGLRGGFIHNYNHYFLHGHGFHDLYRGTEEVFERGAYFPDRVTEHAVRFIDRNRDRPFLLYVAFNIPHYPEQADSRFDERYRHLPMPRRSYAKMISTTDDRIGRIMARLEQHGLRENTIVLFMSDNGHSEEDIAIRREPHASGLPLGTNYGANGGGGYTGRWIGHKGTFLEGGLRVPAILSYPPKLPAGAVRGQLVTAMDWMPTILELCGLPKPEVKLDGHSLLPVIASAGAASPYDAVHWQWGTRWAVRRGDWKLLGDKEQAQALYRLDDAEPERIDYRGEQAQRVEQLLNLHKAWAEDVRPAEPRPNILFIMADDHAAQAVGAYGSRLARLNPTPNLDALAAGGMRFDRVFCNNAICTPSRASILTGQYSQANGVLDLLGRLPPEKQVLPAALHGAGYQTAVIGKWHLKDEPSPFDYYCVLPGQGRYFDPVFRLRGPEPWPRHTIRTTGHSSDVITQLTLNWLETGRDRSRPFFLMHHFKAPHDMFAHAARYDSYLADITIPEPDNLHSQPGAHFGSVGTRGEDDALVGRIGSSVSKRADLWGLPRKLGVEDAVPEPAFTAETYQRYLKRYLRCVKGVDDNLGKLFDYLKGAGLWENTVIVYTSDQGMMLGEHDYIDKRWMYEEAMRMPFVVHWPKVVEAGGVNDWLINNTDFAPTLLELAGAGIPASMQGRSFAGALRGRAKPADWRSATYYRYWMHMAHNLGVPAHFGLRTDRHKLIFFYGRDFIDRKPGLPTPPAWELYDLQRDPHEMHNRYADPAYGAVVARLKAELKRQREALNETDGAYPELRRIIEAHWNR